MAAPVADQRILRGVASTLTWRPVGGDGEAAEPAGDVTVGIVNSAGETVVVPATATSGEGSEPRTYTLSAANNTDLDLLTVTWTDGGDSSAHTTLVEVVGGFFFTIAEARAADPNLAKDDKFPTPALVEARRQVEEEFEQICDLAFVPRFRVDRVAGHGRTWALLEQPHVRRVRSITELDTGTTTTPWTEDDLLSVDLGPACRISSRAGKTFACDVAVAYEHGYDRPPAEVKRAAIQRLRYFAAQPSTGIPDRATSFSVAEGGSYRLDTAKAYKTGVPDIDAVLGRWSERYPGCA